MFLSKYFFFTNNKRLKQEHAILHMQKRRIWRKFKSVKKDYELKKKAFTALKVNKYNEKKNRSYHLHRLLHHRFENYGLELPVAIEHWIYDQ